MASLLPLHLTRLLHCSKPVYSDKKPSIRTGPLYSWKFGGKERENYDLSKDYPSAKCDLVCNPSSRWFPWRVSASAASFFSDQTNSENASPLVKHSSHGVEFNRVNCLVWVLHESARSFSLAVESLKLPGSGAELSNAWLGKDVHEWHKVAGYQVAVYALLKTAIGVEFLLSRERSNGPLPVQEILGKRLNFLENYIEIQLRERHAELVNWFRRVELPRIEAYFAPLLKKWSMEFAGSGVAGIIVAITCCAAVSKLGPRQSSCASVSLTIDDILVELMELSHRLVSVDKLYNLAAEAGCELLFLTYFGTKILPSKNVEELEFWIGLAKQKLLVAFHEEPVISGLKVFQDEVKADSLAVLGLFAYLGRSTRLYLSKMGIKDIDDLVKDFLSYLECGILFIHPEFSSTPVYQLFMDVIKDEIGWLDFYASLSFVRNPERKRSKQHPIQAEKEMILSAVFTVCYDVFSGFAHLSRSTLQPLDAELLAFLLRSQNLLALCLEDYWAAYDRSCREPVKIMEAGVIENTSITVARPPARLSPALEAQQMTVLMAQECLKNRSLNLAHMIKPIGSAEMDRMTSSGLPTAEPNILSENLLRKYSVKFVSTSSDLWMGTQLLLIDITVSMELLLKQWRGHKVSKREQKKLKRTLKDIASLIPVTILMLLPVTAVGHAAIFTAIKKYLPSMIPSPYSSERLAMVRQLRRTKKMEIRLWSNLEDPSSRMI
ncbi:uncharacterized protein LOC116195805 isoform X1 [Punica granatum]|uniref:Uncharacterized protein LOC116195805 isoform X1 n=1 Tax=Punica granatum TaxID=22663 RepID=A0A6P8CDF5_PUNGR|nr:uncharacterized protein LOC116195805 isoform X1 [Punica granatum]